VSGGADSRKGALTAFAAYLLWGFFPLYFHTMAAADPLEIVAHRIAWSALFTLGVVVLLGKTAEFLAVFRDPRRLFGLALSAICISVNWGVFVWAVPNGHVLDAGVGYFVCPLCSVLLGMLFFRERLSRRQAIALSLVCTGVAVLAVGKVNVWLVLFFALSFALYGLIRKAVPVDAMVGVTVETLLVAPLAVIFLVTRPAGGAFLTGGIGMTLLLASTGPVTAIPMVMFAYGARRISLATLGLMMYIHPTLQSAIAVVLLGEPLKTVHLVALPLIWAGLVIYSWSVASSRRRLTSAPAVAKCRCGQ
jgi:chloramphenicol-sensitive protein RarD